MNAAAGDGIQTGQLQVWAINWKNTHLHQPDVHSIFFLLFNKIIRCVWLMPMWIDGSIRVMNSL